MERLKLARSASGTAARTAGIEPRESLTDFRSPRIANPLMRAMCRQVYGGCSSRAFAAAIDLDGQISDTAVHRLDPVRHAGANGNEVTGRDRELGAAPDRRSALLAGLGVGGVD